MDLSGKFVVFDGPDGAGKGTQLARLREWIESRGGACVAAKDPGGTPIGDRIRQVLLNYDLREMSPVCEALLFMASRAQLVHEIVRPALAAGRTVLGDRFISSTCAYQVAAGFPLENVLELGHIAVGDTWPDLTIVLDVPPEVGFQRTGRTPGRVRSRANHHGDQLDMFGDTRVDAMEARSMKFHRQVRALFRRLPEVYPRPVVVIDGRGSPEAVFSQVLEALERAFS